MKKILKRIAAMSAAVMMMATMVFSASAEEIKIKVPINGEELVCSAENTGNRIYVSTTAWNNRVSTSVSVSATYKLNSAYVPVGNCYGGPGTCQTSVSKPSGATWAGITTEHGANTSEITINDATWKNRGLI